MKNILIVASLYGSKRVLGLAKCLPEFGWSPTIITPPMQWQPTIISGQLPSIEGVQIIETGHGGIKKQLHQAGLSLRKIQNHILGKMLRLGGSVVNYPDSYSEWYRFALQTGREVLDKGDIEAIMSICPVTSHIVACQLKKEYPDVKWICDLPDLWSQNHNYGYGKWRRRMDTKLELKTLAGADVLTTSSEPRAEQLRELHKGKQVVGITLGYDEREYGTGDVELDVELTKKFTITYTGLIYPKRQNPMILLTALSSLIKQNKIDSHDCFVVFCGEALSWLASTIIKLGLQDIALQFGRVPHRDAVIAQKKAQLLWLLDWDDPDELGVHPGKIFEYLGARRPILATGGIKGNVVNKLIQETCSGYHAVDVGEVEQVLLKCYSEWKQTGRVEYHGVGQEKYTWREMTRKYVELLEVDNG